MQTLIMMADFGGYCFWKHLDNQEYVVGNAVSSNSLPLPVSLVEQLDTWVSYFEENINLHSLNFNTDVEAATFDSTGKNLWKQVQVELKDKYVVKYYSEIKKDYITT